MSATALRLTPEEQASTLRESGFIVLQLIPAEELAEIRAKTLRLMANLPELTQHARDKANAYLDEHGTLPEDFDPGRLSDGALPWTSTFHNTLRRGLETRAKAAATPMFSALCEKLWSSKACVLEMLPDRLMYRTKKSGSNVNEAGNWHRDFAPGNSPDDIIFGGWINLDTDSQSFMLAPKSHSKEGSVRADKLFPAGQKAGFVKLPKEEENDAQQNAVTRQVPPGALLIFFESIQHALLKPTSRNSSKRFPMLRLFIGWRLGQDAKPMQKDLQGIVARGSAIPLKASTVAGVYKPGGQISVRRNSEWGLSHLHDALLTSGGGKHADEKRPIGSALSLKELADKGVLSEAQEARLRKGEDEWLKVAAPTVITGAYQGAPKRRVFDFSGGAAVARGARHSLPRLPSHDRPAEDGEEGEEGDKADKSKKAGKKGVKKVPIRGRKFDFNSETEYPDTSDDESAAAAGSSASIARGASSAARPSGARERLKRRLEHSQAVHDRKFNKKVRSHGMVVDLDDSDSE